MNKKVLLIFSLSLLALFILLRPSSTILSAVESCTRSDGTTGMISSTTGDCIPFLTITGTSCTTDTNQSGTYDSTGKCVAASTSTTATSSSGSGLIPCGHGSDPANACTLCDFIIGFKNLIDFGLKLLVTVAVVGIFIGGVTYIVSGGNEQLLTKAKTFLSSSLIGFTIVLTSWLLVNVAMWALSYNTALSIGKTNWYTFQCEKSSTTTSGAVSSVSANTAVGVVGAACSSLPNQVPTQCQDASPALNTLIECIAGKLNNNVQISSISDGNGGLTCYQDHPTWTQCPASGGLLCCYHTINSCHYGGTCGGPSLAVDLVPYNGTSNEAIKTAVTACNGRPNSESSHIHASVQTTCCNL